MSVFNYLTAGKESKQSVSTPPDLVEYVKRRWPIAIDLAASADNAICSDFLSEAEDSMLVDWMRRILCPPNPDIYDLYASSLMPWPRPVGWLNPPFGKLDPWMEKSRAEANRGAHTVSLVPASIESGWFSQHVYQGPCTVYVLKGRLKFPGYANVAGQGHMLIDWHGGAWGGIHVIDWRLEMERVKS